MSIRNILCAYSGESAQSSGLRHAIRLARHHDAWLTGVVPHGRPFLESRFAGQVSAEVLRALAEADDRLIAEIRDRFETITEAAGLAGRAEFLELDTVAGAAVEEFARAFDLVVTGVHTDVASAGHLSAHPDQIALGSGRPVLVVPDGYDSDGLADHAIVAWDGKRSAARALGDAMPFLEEKARVTILTVSSSPIPGVDRILTSLERHGIAADHLNRTKNRTVAHTLLETAREIGARLIVMGAFEHSKFHHDLLGGVTTDVMRDAHVPVFMSH